MNELLHVSPDEHDRKVNELITAIVVYDSKTEQPSLKKLSTGAYQLDFSTSIKRYDEDGLGEKTDIPVNDKIEFGLVYADGSTQTWK